MPSESWSRYVDAKSKAVDADTRRRQAAWQEGKDKALMPSDYMKAIGSFAKGVGSLNSPEWWTKIEQLIENVSKIQFQDAISGEMHKLGENQVQSSSDQGVSKQDMELTPGIFVTSFIPTIGGGSIQVNPSTGLRDSESLPVLHFMIKELKTKMESIITVDRSYTQGELGEYVLLLDSIIYTMVTVARIITYLERAENPENRYESLALAQACVPNDELMHRLQLVDINELKSLFYGWKEMLKGFFIPTGIDYFKVHSTYCANVYRDMGLSKSQFYLIKPAGYFSAVTVTTQNPDPNFPLDAGIGLKFQGYGLDPNQTEPSDHPVVDMFNYALTVMYLSLINTPSFGKISADLLKINYKDPTFSTLFFEGFDVIKDMEPVYEVEILNKIKNAYFFRYTAIHYAYPAEGTITSHFYLNPFNVHETPDGFDCIQGLQVGLANSDGVTPSTWKVEFIIPSYNENSLNDIYDTFLGVGTSAPYQYRNTFGTYNSTNRTFNLSGIFDMTYIVGSENFYDVLHADTDVPSMEEIVVNTCHHVCGDKGVITPVTPNGYRLPANGTLYGLRKVSVRTDIFVNPIFYLYHPVVIPASNSVAKATLANLIGVYTGQNLDSGLNGSAEAAFMNKALISLNLATKFNYHPDIFMSSYSIDITGNTSGMSPASISRYGDILNFAKLEKSQLRKLHLACNLSVFRYDHEIVYGRKGGKSSEDKK